MTIFHVKAVINIIITPFCNRKEDELIKCGEVTFSIVYLPILRPFTDFAVFTRLDRDQDNLTLKFDEF